MNGVGTPFIAKNAAVLVLTPIQLVFRVPEPHQLNSYLYSSNVKCLNYSVKTQAMTDNFVG